MVDRVLHQATKKRDGLFKVVSGMRRDRVQPDEDDRKEDDVDEDEYNNGDATPL